jgi:NTE family protein
MTSAERSGRRASIHPQLGDAVDIFRVREYFEAITKVRDIARRVREDAAFLNTVRRALLKLPTDARPSAGAKRLWPPLSRTIGLRRTRVAIVATGGSGALASLVGVLRACQEQGIRPHAMSFASGAALFAFPIAAGKTPDEVAEFALGLDPTDWVDPNWRGFAGILPTGGRGFAGIIKGSKLERTYSDFLGDVTLGELQIPAYAPIWNIEHNRIEYIGPRTHPQVSVAHAIRMSISLPLFVDPVWWRGGHWCDGGIVDIFPVHPVLDIEQPPDVVLAVNCFYPPGFAGEDATGWREHFWSVLDIADQVVTAQHVQLARENLRRLRAEVPTVMMMDPVPYEVVRRAGFYAQFLERRDWPAFMRAGRRDATRLLRKLPQAHPVSFSRAHTRHRGK